MDNMQFFDQRVENLPVFQDGATSYNNVISTPANEVLANQLMNIKQSNKTSDVQTPINKGGDLSSVSIELGSHNYQES